MINEQEIRKAIGVLKPNNQMFEVRILENNGKTNYSGYFDNAETLIKELKRSSYSGCNFYITLNLLKDACFDREQKNKFVKNPKNTTSDNDVKGIEWIMVDLDPKRPSGTASSDEELRKAKELGNKVFRFMETVGFEKPITAMSGNGVHLLYRIKLTNIPENVKLIDKSLKTLNMFFDDDYISVDMKNFNPARICKLYGTTAQKGANSEQRPYRDSYIINADAEVKETDIQYIKKLCDMYPKEVDKPRQYNNYSPVEFDLEDWMNKYYLRYEKRGFADGTKYILEQCPFDSNHKGKDACIFRSRNGSIGFHCFHNSCAGKTWQDVRVLYEPDAYEKKQKDQYQKMYGKFNRDIKVESKPIVKEEGKPVFYTPKDIYKKPKVDESFVLTGTDELDKRVRGLKKGYVTVVSGLRGSAKSTLLSQWGIEGIESGNNVACYSGELTDTNFMKWMNLQAAGKSRVEPTNFPGYYTVPRIYREKIADWMDGHFWLYNNDYGNDFMAVMEQFEKQIEDKKLDLLMLDNLMSFDIKSLNSNKFEAQTDFIWKLQGMAKKHNVHIIFVAHPRKAMGFLRLDDISGSADIGNAVDDAFIVHRNNNDFKRLSKSMFGWKDDNVAFFGTNVIEVAKDRDGGTQDLFIPLWYEIETKRMKNYVAENKIYGWDKENDGFTDATQEYIPF